jgi:DNA modification methylase
MIGEIPVYCAYDEILDIGKAVPNPKNPNQHPYSQISLLAKIIKAQGWRQPITISNRSGLIVKGHGRLQAAIQLNADRVPVEYQNYETEADEIADLMADNRLSELSEMDNDTITELLQDLNDEYYDIELAGYTEDDFEKLLSEFTTMDDEPEETQEDDYDGELPNIPTARRGDIYQLGSHRLMCGDSTDAKDVERLMDGANAKMLFTSPPYSDMREYEGGKNLDVANVSEFIQAYSMYTNYQCVNLGIQRKDHEIYPYWDEYIQVAKDSGYKLMAWNVWDKLTCGSIYQQNAFFPLRHEFVFVFGTKYFEINKTWEKKEESIFEGEKTGTYRKTDGTTATASKGDMSGRYKQMESVLSLLSEHGTIRSEHPATFPVGLPAEYIKAMTREEDVVIEPFCGSGSTLIACEQLGRKCYAMELEPKYIDVIIRRWEAFTGEEAKLIYRTQEAQNDAQGGD